MKKIILLTAVMCLVVLQCFSQVKSFEELCEKYENYEGVESINVNQFSCFLLSLFVNDKEGFADKLMKKSTGFRLLTFEGERGNELCKDVAGFVTACGLEELITIQEEDSEVKIYIENKGKEIQQLFISVIDTGKEIVFIQLKGKFPLSLIKKLVIK